MNLPPVLILISIPWLCISCVEAQNEGQEAQNLHPFHPSLVAVFVIMAMLLSIGVFVIAYAKFCYRSPFHLLNRLDVEFQGGLTGPLSRLSGIDKNTIDKIPVFRFSDLRGSKKGLECAVCLSAFEDIEILRLLPKCNHAFHRNCIDEWLESHSSCPLCRQRFETIDFITFTFSSSLRLFQVSSNLTDHPDVELFIQREQDEPGPSRFNIEGSFPDKNKSRYNVGDQKLHKLKHRIIVSDVIVKHRWSDANSSDLLSLNSEMLDASSSERFSSLVSKSTRFSLRLPMSNDLVNIKDDIEKKSRTNESKISSSVSTLAESHEARMMSQNGKRSMSDIVNVSRFKDLMGRNKAKESSSKAAEEKRRRLWLPIARTTLQWFAGLEKCQQQPDQVKMLPSNV